MSTFVANTDVIGRNVKIGSFCIVEEFVVLEDNVSIGAFSVVNSHSRSGEGRLIETHNKIGSGVFMGKGCKLTSFCEIRDRCQLDNNVRRGSRCTLSAGIVVQDNVTIKYSFVFTDTPDIRFDSNKKVGLIKEGARFGANVTILPGLTIGRNAEIGAFSQVRHDVPDNEIWYGNPAKFYGTID